MAAPGGFVAPPPDGGQGYPPPQQGYNPYAGQQGAPPPMGYPPPQQGGYPPPQPQPGYNPYGGQQGPPPPVTQQPGAPQAGPPPGYMPAPVQSMVPANCPPGLEYLCQIDQLIVKQKVEMLEAFTGFETKNKYTVKNSMGQDVYKAKEDTDCCTRNICGPQRPFDMIIRDNYDNEVIHLNRPLRCNSCLFPCCLQEIEISSPPGQVIGTVVQDWSLCTPQFSVKDHNGDTVLRIEGPLCTFSFCGDVEFQVLSVDGSTEVGKISKQWSGILREAFTDSDNFGISFPMDLDVRMKATLLGALFLIDFMFFEKAGNQETDGIGMLSN